MPWLLGYLGEWAKTAVPTQYGVQGIPSSFMVNPEGKIIAAELSGDSIVTRLDKYLK